MLPDVLFREQREVSISTLLRRPPLRPSVLLTDAGHLSMDPGSCSDRSWADEVEEAEAARSTGSSAFPGLPPLAAAAHASLVLRASSLDPDAAPFGASPGDGYGERLHFTDSEASFGDSDEPPSSARGRAAAPPRRHRRRRRRRARIGRFAARTPPPTPVARSSPVAAHPPRMSVEPDSDGFRAVVSRRCWRRTTAPRRPVPTYLVGKCFNCLSESHVKADCTSPPRCFHCLGEGHQKRSCPLLGRAGGIRGRSPGRAPGRHGAPRQRRSRHDSLVGTVSARSASTGRSPSVPPICTPPTPEPPVVESDQWGYAGHGEEEVTVEGHAALHPVARISV